MSDMKHPVLFASDLHGNRYAYRRLFALAAEQGIKAVVLGGDLTPKWPVIIMGGRGPVIPAVPSLRPESDNRYTYVEFLKRVRAAAVGRTRAQQIKHWVDLGGYEVYRPGEMLTWDDLMAEQSIMRRIIEGFDATKGPVFTISPAEWDVLEPLLRDALVASKLTLPADAFVTALRLKTLPQEEMAAGYKAMKTIVDALAGKGTPPAVAQFLRSFRPLVEPFLAGDGKVSMSPLVGLMQAAAAAQPFSMALDQARDLSRAANPQVKFLQNFLAMQIRAYRKKVPNGRVFFILGNDDVDACDEVARDMHRKGLATYLTLGKAELAPGVTIAGYPYVPEAEGFYPAWQKSESEIARDLATLEAGTGDKPTVYVVHCPPSLTQLDQSWGGQHFGSNAVHDWIRARPKRAVLSGHIHEAPFLNGGVWRETLGGTPCFQPGGWHDEDLCAVLFDAADPTQAEWIHDPAKVRG